MPRAAGLPIRYKILLAVLVIVTAVVSAITFTMAQLFHADKMIYVRDLSSVNAIHAARETRAALTSYRDRLDVCARLLNDTHLSAKQRTGLLQDVLQDLTGFVALTCYVNGVPLATVCDDASLARAGISAADLKTYRDAHPLPFDRIVAGHTYIQNSTVGERLPTMSIAVASRVRAAGPPLVLCAVLKLDDLMELANRSESFRVFVVDDQGVLLSSRDRQQVVQHARVTGVPKFGANSAALVREFKEAGVDKIAGYAPVEGTDLVVGAEIPRSAAYFASRDLLNRLLFVALLLLAGAAVVSMIWSQTLTRSITRLVDAARDIGQGRFDVKLQVRSRDEIGMLARAFNQMGRELHERERALQNAEGQLIQSEKMAAFGQLGAGVAHEVKNPLAGILGLVQLMRRTTYDDQTLNQNLETVEKETRRCRTIIDNLLRFARQERVGLSPLEIGPVVHDAVAIMRHQLALNHVTLEMSVPDHLPKVQGNANQLQQVVMNLVLNAQQAMQGKAGHVFVEVEAADDKVQLRVRDDGPGIPKEIQQRIFEPFFTTKPSGQGTGLGLSVSYGIVQEHAGAIRVDSEAGKGTTFIIELPVAAGSTAERATTMRKAA